MKLTRVEVGFGKILMSFLYNQKIILYYLIEKISHLLAGSATLFLIDDIIVNEALDNRRQFLLELAISGHHRQHSLWLLTSHTLPFQIISGDKQKCFMFGILRNRTDLNTIHEENDIIGMGELVRGKAQLKWGKHTCLIIRMEHPSAYEIR